MRLVHISDLHLGFRQFQRLTPAGINQREADVADVFRRAIDRIIELRPGIIIIAGDVFHAVRPPNPAILHAFNNFSRLARALPETTIVMLAGNHDRPRSAESVCILRLFKGLGIHVVDGDPTRLSFPEKDLSVLAVPNTLVQLPTLLPDPEFGRNVLAMHAEITGVIPRSVMLDDRPRLEIDSADLHAPAWDYVALGHYHVYRQVAPNAIYSGSTEFTSTNPWGEMQEEAAFRIPGKGFVEFDLETGEHEFHALRGARVFVDLPAIHAKGLTSLELDELIRERVESCDGGIDEKVVRLVVHEAPRHIAREIDHATIRHYKRRALNFLLDLRRPEQSAGHRVAAGAPGGRRPLEETVREKLEAREIDSDIDRAALVDLGLRYLRMAESSEVAPAPFVEVEG